MPRDEAQRLLEMIRRRDRELAEDMAAARLRTVRAVSEAVRSERCARASGQRTARLISAAWRRPPGPQVTGAVHRLLGSTRVTRHRRPGTTSHGRLRVTSVHFRLTHTSSTGAASEHQHYIERDTATIESFGNLPETHQERCRVWQAIGDRCRRRSGSVTLESGADLRLKRRAIRYLREWSDDGQPAVNQRYLGKLERYARDEDETELEAVTIRFRTGDADAHLQAVRTVQQWGGIRAGDDEDTDGRTRSRRRPRARLPTGVREYRPREPVVQRRLVLELHHHLSPREMARVTRAWCTEVLEPAGVGYWVSIHQPEANNDARNYHAHMVFTQCAMDMLQPSRVNPGGLSMSIAHCVNTTCAW